MPHFLDAQSLNDGLAMISDPSATCVCATGTIILNVTKKFTLAEADRARSTCARVRGFIVSLVSQKGINANLTRAEITGKSKSIMAASLVFLMTTGARSQCLVTKT